MTQFIYRNYRFLFFLLSAFFSVHIFPVASALHRYPVLVLQTLSCFVVWLDIKEQKIIMLSNKEKKKLQINHFMTFNIQRKKNLAFDRSKILNVTQICWKTLFKMLLFFSLDATIKKIKAIVILGTFCTLPYWLINDDGVVPY